MTRIGYADIPENAVKIEEISKIPNLVIEGMFTHFARADEFDRSPALVQLDRYLRFAESSGEERRSYSGTPLFQQCGYHPCAGGKS